MPGAAGNSGTEATFDDSIPSAMALPNLLTVGAVHLAGDEAGFTSDGPTANRAGCQHRRAQGRRVAGVDSSEERKGPRP